MSRGSGYSGSGGVGFPGLLAVLFIGLKLCHVIELSWWWLLSPLWISALLALVVIAVDVGVYRLRAGWHAQIRRRGEVVQQWFPDHSDSGRRSAPPCAGARRWSARCPTPRRRRARG